METTAQPYQLFDDLTEEEYAALRDDIARCGVLVPIEFDEDGNVLDGHHRLRACQELGITDYPRVVRAGLDEQGKRNHTRSLQMLRRHLTSEQKRRVIADQLRDTPERSDRAIGRQLGVSHATVASVRNHLVLSGQLDQMLQRIVDRAGQQYIQTQKLQAELALAEEELRERNRESQRQRAAFNACDAALVRRMTAEGADAEQLHREWAHYLVIHDAKQARAVEHGRYSLGIATASVWARTDCDPATCTPPVMAPCGCEAATCTHRPVTAWDAALFVEWAEKHEPGGAEKAATIIEYTPWLVHEVVTIPPPPEDADVALSDDEWVECLREYYQHPLWQQGNGALPRSWRRLDPQGADAFIDLVHLQAAIDGFGPELVSTVAAESAP